MNKEKSNVQKHSLYMDTEMDDYSAKVLWGAEREIFWVRIYNIQSFIILKKACHDADWFSDNE